MLNIYYKLVYPYQYHGFEIININNIAITKLAKRNKVRIIIKSVYNIVKSE